MLFGYSYHNRLCKLSVAYCSINILILKIYNLYFNNTFFKYKMERTFSVTKFHSEHFALSEIVSPLLNWYHTCARVLPWRENPQPYHVWVSEIMLQQTRVEAVKSYYIRFLEALPSIESLAQAPEQQLLKLWEGLGYYNRVRNMQKAAQIVMERYHGSLPASYEEIQKLPGIGSYTAGAICSIAFSIPAPAVDGNVLRVISRITGSRENISRPETKKALERLLPEIIPEDQPGDFNQSLMELGAMVCLPNGFPDCGRCPVSHLCEACRQGIQMELPVKDGKKERNVEKRTVFLLLKGGKTAIHQRPPKGLLASLWELPNLPGQIARKDLDEALSQWGLSIESISSLGKAKHIFTHLEWQMQGYLIEVTETGTSSPFLWKSRTEIEESYPLPAAFLPFWNQQDLSLF
jgi:A/G-specific adenine glycosylase